MDKFKDLTVEQVEAARDKLKADFQQALDAADATKPETVKAAQDLAEQLDEHEAELSERATQAAEAEDALAALRERKFGADAEAEQAEEQATDEGGGEGEHDMPEGEGADGDHPSEQTDSGGDPAPAPAAVPVAAKGTKTATAKGRAAQLARRTSRPAAPSVEEQVEKAALSIVAAADSGFSAGETISFEQVGQSIMTKIEGFAPPSGDGTTEQIHKFQTAAIHVDFPDELTITERKDPMEVLEYAAKESRLEGESLVAAGGWCAPSEVLYGLDEDESLDGILSLPEVAVKRGGIRYTPGPQFADFYASPGFAQTESQAIAGVAKTAVEVSCPTFTEVRLEVEGLWIKVPILTEVGYPELVRRFASGTMTAHEHWKNARLIARIVALSTTRDMTATGLGAAHMDALEGITLVADQRRQSQRLKFNRSLEVVVPFWVRNVYLNDLGRRMGRDKPATEAELNQWFASRYLAVSYVYDWQVLPSGATDVAYPATYSALVYPAGTFIKGTSAIIKLGAIYDSAQLAVNTYTGSFSEEGLLVAKMKLGSDLLTNLATCAAGRVGAADLTCA